MEEFLISTPVKRFEAVSELDSDAQHLMHEAIQAQKNAYAPYSGFSVGAALQLESGEIITGNNQENAAYPSGLCAERVAFFYAGSQFPKSKIIRVAIVAGNEQFPISQPIAPCGACRQSMLEYEVTQHASIQVLLKGYGEAVYQLESIKSLLPLFFFEEALKSHSS
jgi:cytidine deaminase